MTTGSDAAVARAGAEDGADIAGALTATEAAEAAETIAGVETTAADADADADAATEADIAAEAAPTMGAEAVGAAEAAITGAGTTWQGVLTAALGLAEVLTAG